MISRKGSSGRGLTSNGIDWAYTTCSSEPVFSTSSMAVREARSASSEPSVASRTFVGNTLMLYLLLALASHSETEQPFPAPPPGSPFWRSDPLRREELADLGWTRAVCLPRPYSRGFFSNQLSYSVYLSLNLTHSSYSGCQGWRTSSLRCRPATSGRSCYSGVSNTSHEPLIPSIPLPPP